LALVKTIKDFDELVAGVHAQQANDHHQRCEPAADSSRIVTEPNGWLASAAWCGWVMDCRRSPYDNPKRIVSVDHAAAENNLTSVRSIKDSFAGLAVTHWQ
jgi:hypothetical protein